MAQQDQKTEQPTRQKQQKARREGRFPVSRDLISALQFVTVLVVAIKYRESVTADLIKLTENLVRDALSFHDLTTAGLIGLFRSLLFPFFLRLFLIGFGIMGIVMMVQLASTGFGFSVHQLLPDPARLSPLSKLKQLPKENLQSVFRSTLLIVLVSYFLYSSIQSEMDELGNLAAGSLGAGIFHAGDLISRLLWRLAAILAVFGVADLIRQRSKFQKNLRMSKQEIKDELKDSEGNIQLKLRIRRLQREAIRRNMIKAVSSASVVITNPTHYAIALQYDVGTRSVPTVVAKGKNYLAKVIRERAREHDIPIIENKPLAQALYQAVDIGNEIPPALYRAVAEVLAQIYRIMNR